MRRTPCTYPAVVGEVGRGHLQCTQLGVISASVSTLMEMNHQDQDSLQITLLYLQVRKEFEE